MAGALRNGKRIPRPRGPGGGRCEPAWQPRELPRGFRRGLTGRTDTADCDRSRSTTAGRAPMEFPAPRRPHANLASATHPQKTAAPAGRCRPRAGAALYRRPRPGRGALVMTGPGRPVARSPHPWTRGFRRAGRAGNSETVVVVPIPGGVPVAVRGAQVLRVVVPRAAPQHPTVVVRLLRRYRPIRMKRRRRARPLLRARRSSTAPVSAVAGPTG